MPEQVRPTWNHKASLTVARPQPGRPVRYCPTALLDGG
jgi:hypothetical protein